MTHLDTTVYGDPEPDLPYEAVSLGSTLVHTSETPVFLGCPCCGMTAGQMDREGICRCDEGSCERCEQVTYVRCRSCWYEKPVGQPCGEPCV